MPAPGFVMHMISFCLHLIAISWCQVLHPVVWAQAQKHRSAFHSLAPKWRRVALGETVKQHSKRLDHLLPQIRSGRRDQLCHPGTRLFESFLVQTCDPINKSCCFQFSATIFIKIDLVNLKYCCNIFQWLSFMRSILKPLSHWRLFDVCWCPRVRKLYQLLKVDLPERHFFTSPRYAKI